MPLSLLSALSRVSLVSPVPDLGSSGAELATADGRSLPLVAAKLRGDAGGGIARLVLEQTFENPYDETLHVTYRMPLPADGAISGYAFEIGGRVITGRVDKKAAAREQFEQAVAQGQTAALLEQQRADIFTQQIGNLPARERLIARITIDQRLAWLPEGEWELRFPTVIGPRYLGADATVDDARATAITVAPDGVDARISIELAITDELVAGRGASSPSHAIARVHGNTVVLGAPAQLDRDLVVRWPVARPEVGLALETARRGDAHHGLLTIVPPAPAPTGSPYRGTVRAVARDLIVLLDTSGSMAGAPLEKAKHVVAMLIEALDEHDRLELIEFSNEPRAYKDRPVAATAEAKRAALAWLRRRSASGGTEMASAVREALHALRPEAQRQVVLVTDGYVGGEQQIIRLLHERLPKGCRMHVLGIGSAVNRSLATALARAGRGAEVLVGLDEDPERGAKRLVDRTRMPILTNVEVSGSALVRSAPEHVPDVFEGSPVVAALELSPDGGELVVRGDLADDAWVQRIRVPARRDGDGNAAIAALYARERVADLEMRATFEAAPAIDREIEQLGVAYQIATRMTSWVAIDHLRRVDPTSARHEIVPQALPYGTSAASFGLRAAAPMFGEEKMLSTRAGMAGFAPPSYSAGASMPVELASSLEARSAPKRCSAWRTGIVFGIWLVVLAAIVALLWWLIG